MSDEMKAPLKGLNQLYNAVQEAITNQRRLDGDSDAGAPAVPFDANDMLLAGLILAVDRLTAAVEAHSKQERDHWRGLK